MELKVILLLSLVAAVFAAPAEKSEADDLVVAEGQNLHSYAAPLPSRGYSGGAVVTSYNRRGSYAQASDIHKPSIYGSRYGAPPVVGATPYRAATVGYAPAPVSYASAPAHRYPTPELNQHAPRSYGPQRNAFSEQSKRISQDPHYDPAKDPVSQYAQYVPVFEYSPKSRSQGNELSIYGYKK